jgi:hypothetical protein
MWVPVFCDLQKNYKSQKAGTSPIDLSAEFSTTLYIFFPRKTPIEEIRKSLMIPQIFVFRYHLSRGVRVNMAAYGDFGTYSLNNKSI